MITWFRRRWQRLMEWWERLQPTLPVRAWQRYGDLRGDRLAGAASFYGFLSLFPLVLLSAVFASSIAGTSGIQTVQDLVDENLPGFGSRSGTGIDVASFYENSGTLGVIGGVTLVYTGLRWVDSIRAAVRSMWRMEDKPGNIITRKFFDLVALAGLGLLLAISWGTSVVLRHAARWLLDSMGFDGAAGAGAIEAISWVLSIGVNTMLFSYLLAGLPRIIVPPRNLLLTALFGAVVFEVLKTFLVSYVVGPASNSAYAAFATPLAMMAWIYLVTRLLMVLAALTVESAIDQLEAEDREFGTHSDRVAAAEGAATGRRRTWAAGNIERVGSGGGNAGAGRAGGAGGGVGDGARGPGAEGTVTTAEPSARQPVAVRVAAGTLLGIAGAGLAILAGRVARSVVAARGPRP